MVLIVLAGSMIEASAAGWVPTVPPGCSGQTPGGDEVSIECSLPSVASGQLLVFTANFSGGHDDTKASMQLLVDDVPAPCASDSKLGLFGEDGDVSLYCRLPARDLRAARGPLRVLLQWSHAQYSDTQLRLE